MKKLGLIGGISWVSTVDYYKYINEGVNERLGGTEFAKLIIHSLNYGEIRRNNDAGDWDANLALLIEATEQLKFAGIEAILLCANTAHLLADRLSEKTGIKVIHIAEETADAILKKDLKKVALLGTKFTMEMDFFRDKLTERGIESIIPDAEDRAFIHKTIFDELGRGLILPESKERYLEIIKRLKEDGAQGIILGCTEIPLLIHQEDVDVPVFDTTRIHSDAAVKFITSA